MRTDDEYPVGSGEGGPAVGSDFGNIPEGEDADRDRCRADRAKLTAHETADCAGEALRERYEQEEDGGS